jgi:hypothetical protein
MFLKALKEEEEEEEEKVKARVLLMMTWINEPLIMLME